MSGLKNGRSTLGEPVGQTVAWERLWEPGHKIGTERTHSRGFVACEEDGDEQAGR